MELQSGNAQFGQNQQCFCPVWPRNLKKNNRVPLLYYIKLCASFQSHPWIQPGITVHKCSKFQVKICIFLSRMTLKFDGWPWKNRAHLLWYFKLCASFHSHLWIQNGVTVRKRPIWVKIEVVFSRVTLKFDRWPWKTIGHLFCATSSFVHHWCIQSGVTDRKHPICVKLMIFFSCVTLKFDRWP